MRRGKWFTVLVLSTALLTGCAPKEKPIESSTEYTQAESTTVESATAESTTANENITKEAETDPPTNEYEEVIAVDQLDTKNYTLAWEKDYSDFYETGFKVSIYMNAEMDEEGSFLMDDGQNWLACAEIDGKNYYIFPDEFVQMGSIECNVYMDDQNNPYILLSSSRTASYSLTEFVYTEGKLMKKVILERGNYNYLGKSYIK